MAQIKCSKCAHLNESGASRCSRCGVALPSISFEAGAPPDKAPRPAADSDIRFRRGQVVNNRYTVLDLIGRGGMGCIYKVHDNVLGEDLALKTLLPQFLADKMIIDRFLNEARITRKLAHPNIVRVHDIGTAGKGIFISMEYVQGESLRALLERQQPGERLPVRQVLHIIDQLCLALDYAHQYTIHRDIKPENIMLTEDNRVKLMDFGISKLMDNRFATSASLVMGTPYYMSPEQLRNSRDVDARADIYSVGVVLYEVLTGNMPTGVPKPASQILKEVPPALDGIVAKCVDPDREKRFHTAGELRMSLHPIIEMLDSGKDPKKTLAKRRATGQRRSALSMRHVLAALLIGCILTGVLFTWQGLERLTAQGEGASPLPASLLDSEQGARFIELERLIGKAREALAAQAEKSRKQLDWIDAGEAAWNAALEKARQGEPEAATGAEEALQCFVAALMAPESMSFVPAGTVVVDGTSQYVPAFFMDDSEVTIGLFAEFCRQTPGGWRFPEELGETAEQYPDYPASCVACYDGMAYAAWKGKSLPSRAQWARAAHGSSNASDIYPWGAEWTEGAANLQSAQSAQVRSYSADLVWSGCYDMAGNVAEWTCSPAAPGQEGAWPRFGDAMHVCGGSFLQARPLRATEARPFETRAADLGFRCVLAVPTDSGSVEALLARMP